MTPRTAAMRSVGHVRGTRIETALGVKTSIIVARNRMTHSLVGGVVDSVGIYHLVAILVILYICGNISLIMT